jgi:hypothetical protein
VLEDKCVVDKYELYGEGRVIFVNRRVFTTGGKGITKQSTDSMYIFH